MPVDNNSVEIFLPRIDKPIIVDINDMSKVMQWTNMFSITGGGQGSLRTTKFKEHLSVSHLVLYGERKDNVVIDHKNGDIYDFRRSNLRVADTLESNRNKGKLQTRKCSSKYIGVAFVKRTGKWKAYAHYGSHSIHLGFFDNEVDAAKARDEYVKKHYGGFARLNFASSGDEHHNASEDQGHGQK